MCNRHQLRTLLYVSVVASCSIGYSTLYRYSLYSLEISQTTVLTLLCALDIHGTSWHYDVSLKSDMSNMTITFQHPLSPTSTAFGTV